MNMVALEDQSKPNWLEETAVLLQSLCLEEPRPDLFSCLGLQARKSSMVQCSRPLFIPARGRENSHTRIWLPPGLLLFAQSRWTSPVFRVKGLQQSLMTGLAIRCSKR